MIQLIFDSADKIIPEWENEQERWVFRLAPAGVKHSSALHGRLVAHNAGAAVADGEAVGMIAVRYDGDIARQARVILELPDDVWDDLAGRADDLLGRDSGEEV